MSLFIGVHPINNSNSPLIHAHYESHPSPNQQSTHTKDIFISYSRKTNTKPAISNLFAIISRRKPPLTSPPRDRMAMDPDLDISDWDLLSSPNHHIYTYMPDH